MMQSILVIDDEKNMRWVLERGLKDCGHRIDTAASGLEGLERAKLHEPDLVILDLKMPGIDGLETLKRLKELYPRLPVVMTTAHGTVETAIEAMKCGAADYIIKPFDLEEMKIVIEKNLAVQELVKEVDYLRSELNLKYNRQNIIGKSEAMEKVFTMIERVADSNATVIVYGESGTGKELVARAIHYNSARREKAYIQVNCAALPETLLESELFGHEKGAFTGATARRPGRFELAHHGTLFLDEIGELSHPMQAKLLRVLQEKSFERVGGIETLKVDVRIVAATNRDLLAAIDSGAFREDLYYRLNVIPIYLPPLRERKEDIPMLIRHFLDKLDVKKRLKHIAPEALQALVNYQWPGNVRELENVIERAVIIAVGDTLTLEHVPFYSRAKAPEQQNIICDIPDGGISLEEVEKLLLVKALAKAEGNQTKAAHLLKISRPTLLYRMEKYGLR
ncbi:MAG TPA: sigma-54 dependent transcriptional regulator [Negativicutes bacterium]|nr:sigma-54 dependent transcriptional regulator [Negativicutes bacterium]